MNKSKKIGLSLIVGITGALVLSACSGSIFDLVNNKDNVTSFSGSLQTLKYNQEELDETVGDYDMPSTGTENILVIPVKISDYATNATETVKNDIKSTFFGASSDTGWESLSSYYYKSSYGKLTINGTVSDWYDCGYSAQELSNLTSSSSGYDPTWTVLEGAISWYKKTYNTSCTEFDNNGDGLIDGVWLIYSAPDYGNDKTLAQLQNKDVFWAYTFSDYSVTEAYTTNPIGYHYSWASYDFMYSGQYDNNALDSHTYVHETGHLMGLADYYVASEDEQYTKQYPNIDPMGAIDMMDYNVIDHNSFSKMCLGWTSPYLGSEGIITLHPFETTGECIIFPTSDGWNGSAFDEYILAEFYTPTGLNYSDSQKAYENGAQGFTQNGVRLFHVDARLAVISSKGFEKYTDTVISTDSTGTTLAHSNSSGYNYTNQQNRLIQTLDCTDKNNFDMDYYVKNGKKYGYYAKNTSLFQDGDSFTLEKYSNSFPAYRYNAAHNLTMNDGTSFPYKIAFSNMSSDSITLTISKI
jgi:M6 family metalloprotease-like protein